jgi:exopolysaccharide biosynthesis polyprenyl glycosylphosphotransferase
MFARELKKQQAVFVAADLSALLAAFVTALYLHDPSGSIESRLLETSPSLLSVGTVGAAVLAVSVFHSFGLYRMRNGGLKEAIAIAKGCSVTALVCLLVGFIAHLEVSRITVALAYLGSMPLVILMRSLTRSLLRRAYANPAIAIPLAVVGFNEVAHYLLDQLLDRMTPYEPVGFIAEGEAGRQYRGYPVIGPLEKILDFAKEFPSLEVAIALPRAAQLQQEELVKLCERARVRWWMVPSMLQSLGMGITVDWLGSVPLIGPRGSNIEGLNFVIKRGFDLIAGTILLVVAAPALALGALAVRLTDGSPILFRQTRIGIRGKPFELLKLRTMRKDAGDVVHRNYVQEWIRNGTAAVQGNNGHSVYKLADDDRITLVGRILRRFSIDELPQLVNVVRGEMSLIGPRPALPYELSLYDEWHRRRLEGLPGITGLWQVSGRNRLSFEEMVRLDVQYLEDWSFVRDLRILARTLPILLRGEGV